VADDRRPAERRAGLDADVAADRQRALQVRAGGDLASWLAVDAVCDQVPWDVDFEPPAEGLEVAVSQPVESTEVMDVGGPGAGAPSKKSRWACRQPPVPSGLGSSSQVSDTPQSAPSV